MNTFDTQWWIIMGGWAVLAMLLIANTVQYRRALRWRAPRETRRPCGTTVYTGIVDGSTHTAQCPREYGHYGDHAMSMPAVKFFGLVSAPF